MQPVPQRAAAPCVLITGGQGALAQACAAAFREKGWVVIAPSHEEMDVSSAASVEEYFGGVSRLDALVNNAAVLADKSVFNMREEDWEKVVGTNLKGAFLCSRAALAKMSPQKSGHLIHIGSWSGMRGAIGQANYAAAKAGLVGFSTSLARECGSDGIQSNVVLPGYMKTPMTRGVPPESDARIREAHVLGRLNTVEEAASFIAHLAGMRMVSGQIFQLDSRISPWA